MATNLSNVSSGSIIETSKLESNDAKVEKYLNGEIQRDDINVNYTSATSNAEGVVETHHVRPANFFGSPSPRTELVSSDVHFRQGANDIQEETFLWRGMCNSNEDEYIPIKGLAATIHVTPKNPGEQVRAVVFACAYIREHSFGGGDGFQSSNSKNSFPYFNRYHFAKLAMFHQTENNSRYFLRGTTRDIYAGSSFSSRTRPSSTRSLTWHKIVTLQHGINHLYIGAAIGGITAAVNNARVGQRLWCSGMNFIVDVQYI